MRQLLFDVLWKSYARAMNSNKLSKCFQHFSLWTNANDSNETPTTKRKEDEIIVKARRTKKTNKQTKTVKRTEITTTTTTRYIYI